MARAATASAERSRVAKIRANTPAAEQSPHWKGDDAGYSALHKWAARHFDRPEHCEKCETHGRHWAARDGKTYTRNREDWLWLCPRCHWHHDRTGWKPSTETRARISQTMKGRPPNNPNGNGGATKGRPATGRQLEGLRKGWEAKRNG